MPNLLKFESKREASLYVGTYISKEVASLLTLYCLANRKHKATLLTDLLNKFIKDVVLKQDKDNLYESIVELILNRWKSMTLKQKKLMKFAYFCNSINLELKNKGLDKDTISVILELAKKERYERAKTEQAYQ